MQIREIRLVRMMIAQDLNLRVRSTGLTDAICVLKYPHDNARNASDFYSAQGWQSNIQTDRTLRLAYGVFRNWENVFPAPHQNRIHVSWICGDFAVATLQRFQARDDNLRDQLLKISVPHTRYSFGRHKRIQALHAAE